MALRRRQWDNLLNALDNGTCVLLLGPGVSTAAGGGRLTERFATALTEELQAEGIAYDEAARQDLTYIMQRFTTIPDVMPNDPGFEAKEFYEKNAKEANAVQRTLAALPFSLIINTSPDDLMVQALKAAGKYRTEFAYYNFRKHQEISLHLPSTEAPLVYNLFGYYGAADSLVLTEADQVDFTTRVVRDDPPLPPGLLGLFNPLKTYLFLGFDWEQWRLRLLLRSLRLEKECHLLSPAMRERPLRTRTRDFYESQFHFSFITEEVSEFVTLLRERFEEHGGKVTTARSKQLYIVSALTDESYRDALTTALRQLPVEVSHAGLVLPGEHVPRHQEKALASADLLLLLLSPDFLDDEQLMTEVLPRALERHRSGTATVGLVLARPCQWEQAEGLTSLPLLLPRKGNAVRAVSTWEDMDEAYVEIAKAIGKAVERTNDKHANEE